MVDCPAVEIVRASRKAKRRHVDDADQVGRLRNHVIAPPSSDYRRVRRVEVGAEPQRTYDLNLPTVRWMEGD